MLNAQQVRDQNIWSKFMKPTRSNATRIANVKTQVSMKFLPVLLYFSWDKLKVENSVYIRDTCFSDYKNEEDRAGERGDICNPTSKRKRCSHICKNSKLRCFLDEHDDNKRHIPVNRRGPLPSFYQN